MYDEFLQEESPLFSFRLLQVGVDPLLRTSIWDHLTEMSASSSVTIVITTHYIEEARQANRVGMMRFGKLLAEDKPDALLSRFGKNSLEDVFLELCLQDGDMETAKVREERKDREDIVKGEEMCTIHFVVVLIIGDQKGVTFR